MDTTTQSSLIETIGIILAGAHGSDPLPAVLKEILQHFNCALGTIHGIDAQTGMLTLRAQKGLPAELLDRVRTIPIGKGMAGIAAERREPVQVCNLQKDTSGVAKPAAKETKMEGSVAVPIIVGDALRGTLGIAKSMEYEFTATEIKLLSEIGARIGPLLS